MTRSIPNPSAAHVLLTAMALAASAPVALVAQGTPAVRPPAETGPSVAGDTGHGRYTAADVQFMSGMIHHHAQAVLMAGWAPTHGASGAVRALCDRIVVGQRDEIALMSRWLRDRHEAVPDVDGSHMLMGMEDAQLMPGMLTGAQLVELERTQGPAFDELFLRDMIRHHQGAITMVNQLFAVRGSGEEETVFRLAANIFADQTTEIGRMQRMLADALFSAR